MTFTQRNAPSPETSGPAPALYADPFNDNDGAKLRQAFDDDAWIFFVVAEGSLHMSRMSDHFERWASPPGARVVGCFIGVTQVGDAASVQTRFDSLAPKDGSTSTPCCGSRRLDDHRQDRHVAQALISTGRLPSPTQAGQEDNA